MLYFKDFSDLRRSRIQPNSFRSDPSLTSSIRTNSMKSLFENDVPAVKSATKMKRFSRAQPLHPNWGRDHRQNTGEALNRQSYSNHLRNGDFTSSVFVGINDDSGV